MPLLFVRESNEEDELDLISKDLKEAFVDQERYEFEFRTRKKNLINFIKGVKDTGRRGS